MGLKRSPMSVFSSLFGGGGNSAAKYMNTQNGLIANNTALVGGLDSAYDTAAQQGAWDPNVQLDQLKTDTAYQTGINTGNAAAAARTLGYRPGDSVPIQQQQAIDNQSQLQYADMANRIRTGALQAGYQAAAGLASEKANIYGQSLGANGNMLNDAERQDAQQGAMLGNLLGTALPFLGGLSQRSTTNSTPYAPYAVASYNPYATNAYQATNSTLGGTDPSSLGFKVPYTY